MRRSVSNSPNTLLDIQRALQAKRLAEVLVADEIESENQQQESVTTKVMSPRNYQNQENVAAAGDASEATVLRIGGSGPHHCLRQLQEQLRHPIMRNSTGFTASPHGALLHGMLCRTAGDNTVTAERGGSQQRLKMAHRNR